MPQDNIGYQGNILILDQNITTTKQQRNNCVELKTNSIVVLKGGYFKSHGITG